jgi:trehalose 6-phosphate phosphatase
VDARTQLVDSLRPALAGALLAFDFDGTLAPLVDDPERSRLTARAPDVLAGLAARGAQIALVTGRDALTVLRLSGLADLPGLLVAGIYGAEVWSGGNLRTLADKPELAEAVRRAGEFAATERGVWVEDKRLSAVVHFRTAADPAASFAQLDTPIRHLGRELGLDVHPGRDVLELRLPGYDKGTALRELVAARAPDAVFYAGDDVGDLPAFAAVAELRQAGTVAWSVAAGDPPLPELVAAADIAVDGPDGVVDLLTDIAA